MCIILSFLTLFDLFVLVSASSSRSKTLSISLKLKHGTIGLQGGESLWSVHASPIGQGSITTILQLTLPMISNLSSYIQLHSDPFL
jgi:hypothetical protein